MSTRLERKRERDSLKQAGKYLFLTLIGILLVFKFGLPGLIRLAGFISGIRSANQPIEVEESIAPPAPTMLSLPEATNSASLTVSGYSQAGITVRLSRDGIKIEETLADNEGDFEFKGVILKDGDNELYAQADDNQGHLSEPSRSYTITYDSIKPELTVDNPDPGQRFFDKDSPITLNGTTEAGITLTVNNKFIRIDSEGNFSASWPLNEGDNQLDFVAIDPAGNETKTSLTVNYAP